MARLKTTGECLHLVTRFIGNGLWVCRFKNGGYAFFWPDEIVLTDSLESVNCPRDSLPLGALPFKDTWEFYHRRDMISVSTEDAKLIASSCGLQIYVLCTDGAALEVPDMNEDSRNFRYAIKLEDWLRCCGRIGKYDDEQLLAAYKKTGLKPEEIQEVVDMFKSEIDKNVPAEVKGWMERCVWHCHKCAELDAKNKVLENELTKLKIDEAKKMREDLSKQIHDQFEEFTMLMFGAGQNGDSAADVVLKNASAIAASNLIVKAFDRADLQYLQLKALSEANTGIGLLHTMVENLPQRCDGVGYSWNDAKDAIFKTVAYCERLIEEGIKKQDNA